ncbi:MAG: DEAD/DEAH box helicase [Sphaerochaetaceae bacterium]|nr:DEAD/DEAH box helicase [Sphaerochaetaceae bacterium]
MNFKELALHKEVLKGIENAGFETCMGVQEQALPAGLSGYDLMVQSKTGSGKTAVFVISFLEEYLRAKEEGRKIKCLVIAPTRELAQQIATDAKVLSSGIKNFTVGCFYGGVGYEKQEKTIKKGCDFFVGTPGRLIDFMKDGTIDSKSINTFVIDEADRLFDMGFYPDIKRIFGMLVPREERQTMLFSATLEEKVRNMAWEYMNDPKVIELEGDSITVDKITQELYHVAKSEKFYLLLQLLASEKPEEVLIFTNSRYMTTTLSKRLSANGYTTACLSGDLTQKAREESLKKMKEGKIKVLVATDVAARGLQIDDLPLVVNYDVPEDYENYVHRIGRTARAGKSGKAITLADEQFVYGLEAIEKYINMKIPVIWPDNLPEVEDKSLNMDLNVSEKKTPSKKNAPKKEKPKKETQKKPSSKKPAPRKSLGQMSEKERMEYYRKKYGFEPVAKPEKKVEKVEKVEEVKPEKKGFIAAFVRKLFKGRKNEKA